jgi:hypothetical protein
VADTASAAAIAIVGAEVTDVEAATLAVHRANAAAAIVIDRARRIAGQAAFG